MKRDSSKRINRIFPFLSLHVLVLIVSTFQSIDATGADLLPDLISWADPSQNYLYGWYLDTNEIPGHTLLRISSAAANIGSGTLELNGSSTSPDVYQRIYQSGGGYVDRYAGTFTFHPTHGHLHYDGWFRFYLRSVLTNNAVGDIIVSAAKTSSSIVDVEHYDAALPGSPASGQYFGGYTQGISVGWADIYGANLEEQWIDVTDVPDGHYWLEEVVDPDDHIKESNETNNTSRILIDLATKPSSNDNFTNATLIPGLTAGLFGANVQATKEAGEPFHFSDAGGASVWYKWTAPSTMNVTISTEGSTFDTILAVYRGTAVNALTLITNNDDVSSSNFSSRVTFIATNGTTYRIAVDGFGSNPPYNGNFPLHFNPALNDNFANAIVVTGNSGTTSGSNHGASKQGGEPKHAGVTGGESIWYNWTAPTTGPFVFDTLGSSFDTLLGIYTGSSVSGLTPIASDDDSGGASASRVTLNATSGVTYRIAVDGKNGANGIVNLNWLGPGLPTIAAQPLATNNFTGATVGFRVVAVSSSPLTYRWMFQGSNLTDNAVVSGSTNANLFLTGITTNNQGTYTVRISNSSGSITSAPANMIVLDSARAVFVEELEGDMGGVVNVPIQMQALGNEHALNFSLLFNPAILSHPRITNSPVGATVSVVTNSVPAGQFGVTLMLPTNQIVAAGTLEWARVLFDIVTGLPEGTTTQIGFGDLPIARGVSATNGAPLTALFAAGHVTLHSIPTVETGTRLPDERYQVLLNGIIGRNYCIEASSNLTTWIPIDTNQIGTNGATLFIDNQATNNARRFYRAWLLP